MLGPEYTPQKTTFRVFAQAPAVVLNLYQPEQHFPLKKRGDVWQVTVPGDLKNRQYTFTANGHEVIDPYARRVTDHDGRGILIDDHTPIAQGPTFPKTDSVIYELHLRDFTEDGKYLSLQSKIPYLKELGVNTVQILPLCEFANKGDYGWGYDSVHFNAPETSYAQKDPVKELKQMIDALHKNGIKVIMDMVYNHTMETKTRFYSFQGLAPDYYYRIQANGEFWNGSGVGNEFRSEAPYARQFIKDSVNIWVNEYKVDGFRFDLMGLIDRQTMEQLVGEHPQLLIYGEPWAAGLTPITITAKGMQKGYGVFNDDFRDALKGSVFKPTEGGYVQLNINHDQVREGLAGSLNTFAHDPSEVINYVECHDNHTLWDRLAMSATEDYEKMDRLCAVALFTAQGIPFIQAGQEFARSKGQHDNTYNMGDAVNKIRWADRTTHQDLFRYYQGLIALRQAHPLFRRHSRQALRFDPANIAFTLSSPQESWKVLLNAQTTPQTFGLEKGSWQVYVNESRAGTEALSSLHDQAVVPPRSALVLGQLSRSVHPATVDAEWR